MLLSSLSAESSLYSKVLFLLSELLSLFMANQSWSLVQQEPQHFVGDFSAPRETTYFYLPHPLESSVCNLETEALCPHGGPEIFPKHTPYLTWPVT